MTAEDGTGYDLLTIKVYILKNPCMNQGVCEGPETDPNCISTNRNTGGEITVPTFLIKYISSSVRLCLAIVDVYENKISNIFIILAMVDCPITCLQYPYLQIYKSVMDFKNHFF